MKSPVLEFYKNLELKKQRELIEAAQGPKKRKRGRPRSKKQYFTEDTQAAIIAYNNEKDSTLRNKIYSEFINYPFMKLTENLIHRFKFYYFDYPTKEVQHEVIVHLLEKLDKFTFSEIENFSPVKKFKNRYKCVLLSFDALQGACEKHTN